MNPSHDDITRIARVCHEANRAICEAFGDRSQLPWEAAEVWQRHSAIRGVEYALAHPGATPAEQHVAWMSDKINSGWVYGPVKDPERKTHPCLVAYSELPPEQRAKDHVFRAIVGAMAEPKAVDPAPKAEAAAEKTEATR